MDAGEELKAAEKALRDFIEETLVAQYGGDWLQHAGVKTDRIETWKQRQLEDHKRLGAGTAEQRLLYYADFYDLPTIVRKNWELFKPCFGSLKRMEVYLERLEAFRNPDAHHRESLPYQKQLTSGMSGEIRQLITVFRSRSAPEPDRYFPKIEYVRDNLGNVATQTKPHVNTGRTLHPGAEVTFIVNAWDPKGQDLEYGLESSLSIIAGWHTSNVLTWQVSPEHIARETWVRVKIRSKRVYHAHPGYPGYDDEMVLSYHVLPMS